MINEAREGLGDVLCHNYAMRRTQEREKDPQRQEEYWREDERVSISKEQAEGRNKKNLK